MSENGIDYVTTTSISPAPRVQEMTLFIDEVYLIQRLRQWSNEGKTRFFVELKGNRMEWSPVGKPEGKTRLPKNGNGVK